MPSLVYQPQSSRKLRTFQLYKKVTSVGAGEENDIRLEGEGIEAAHAIVHFDGKNFNVQSSSRKCEIRVNGKKKRKASLSHRDEIAMGTVTLTFLLYDEDLEDDDISSEQLEAYRRLHDFSRKLLASGDYNIQDIFETLMDNVIALTQADKGFLLVVEAGEMRVRVARNMRRETIINASGQVSDSIVNKVLRSRQPLIVSDALNDSEFSASHSVISLKLCSVMCAPLIDKGSVLGAIYVGNDNVVNLFEKKHLELLSVFTAQASLLVSNAIMVNALQADNRKLRDRLKGRRFGSIIGNSPPMRSIFRKVEKVAVTDVTVLIQGETGTGKELIAREIHERSQRKTGPFITINCGAIPENLLESELFGHVRGAFTGATATRPGKFQLADGGTLFLDEIGEMPVNLQVKLLRVLQERVVTKVGDTRTEVIDIRVVAATNKVLEEAVKEKEFREDLLYRINVVTLNLPPLRDRGDDVVLIASYLLKQYCEDFAIPSKEISPEAAVAMRKYAWPGNIRQLENRLKKAAILSDKAALSPEDLELLPEVLTSIKPLAQAKEDFQRRYINEVLELNDGNRTKTARDLGVDPRTIFRHLEKEAERQKTDD